MVSRGRGGVLKDDTVSQHQVYMQDTRCPLHLACVLRESACVCRVASAHKAKGGIIVLRPDSGDPVEQASILI